MGDRSRYQTGLILVAVLALAWGVNWPAAKAALADILPWTFRAASIAIGGAGLLIISWLRAGRITVPRRQWGPLVVLSLLAITAYHLTSALGLTRMSAGRAVILIFTFPAWAVLMGRFFLGEPITRRRAIALALGVLAMAVLILPDFAAVRASPAGTLYMITGSIAWAGAAVYFKRVDWTLSTAEITGWQLMIGGVPIAVGALILEPAPNLAAIAPSAWAGFSYTAIVSVLIGHWVWYRILQILPVGVASISTLLIPVVGVFAGALLLGEHVGWLEGTALALVTAALFLVLIDPKVLKAASAAAADTTSGDSGRER